MRIDTVQTAEGASPAPVKRAPKLPGLPILGSLPEADRDFLGMLERAAALGDVTRIQLIGEMVLLNRPELVKHVLQDNHLNYRKGFMYRAMKPLVGEGLLTSEGDFWKRQRRLAQPAFHRQRIAAFGTMMTERTASVLERWAPLAASGTPFDLHEEMMALTLTIVGEALFGVDLSGDAAEVGRALSTTLEITDKRFQFPVLLPKWVPTPQNVRFNRAMRVLDGLVDRIIAERHARDVEHDDLLGMLMAARDEDGHPMSDQQLRDEVMTLLLAGHETTANALTWWAYLLATNPEAEARLAEEVRSVLGERRPGLGDLPALGYTRRSFDEAMRLYPPAHTIGRRAIADDVIDGYPIRAGTSVFLSTYVLGRDARFWDEPLRFDPDRFLPERSQGRHPLASFPFASGPRLCIGNNFALMEMHLVGAMISQRYRLELVPGQNVVPSPQVTLRPSEGLKVFAHAR